MNFGCVDESFDLDDLGALEFDLREVFRGDDHVLLRFELVAFYDLIARQGLAAFLALLFVADGAVILLVQQVEVNGFLRIDGIVDADGNGHERESNVSFPDRSHNLTGTIETHAVQCVSGRNRP